LVTMNAEWKTERSVARHVKPDWAFLVAAKHRLDSLVRNAKR
jgi:hypothetical protein